MFSFPKIGHPAAAWIALAPLLLTLALGVAPRRGRPRHASLAQSFLLGLATGAVYFAGTLYWIPTVMTLYGDLNRLVAIAVGALLVAYLALFPAVFAIVVRRLVLAAGPPGLLMAPLVWVATELGRTHIMTGFPWVLLGYSQVRLLAVAQFASLFGVYGVSGLVASVSAVSAYGAVVRDRPRVIRAGAVVAVVLLGVAIWGARRAGNADWTRAGAAVRVALVQGDVDQAEKWSPVRAATIFNDYLALTRQAIASGAQFVIWPESSTPFYYEVDRASADRLRALARESHVPILIGSDQIENGKPTRYYNAAYLVQSDGSTGGVYRKMHLVPFGEYVPLKRILFFAAPLVEAVSDFSPGTEAVLLPVRGHLVSTAICYEIVYPDLVRRFVTGGSELLTTITNDAWFGQSSAPYQHFAQASMRAIEDGRYLVRAANTGVTGIVDPYGHVLAETRIFERTVVIGDARFLRTSTLYARIGDVFAYAAVVITLAALLLARRRVQ